MYSQNEISRRNAKLVSTPLLNRVSAKEPPRKQGQGLPYSVAILVGKMELEAVLAANRFMELHKQIHSLRASDDIQDIMLVQEWQNLRDMFLWLPQDMTDQYFGGQSFIAILEKEIAPPERRKA